MGEVGILRMDCADDRISAAEWTRVDILALGIVLGETFGSVQRILFGASHVTRAEVGISTPRGIATGGSFGAAMG